MGDVDVMGSDACGVMVNVMFCGCVECMIELTDAGGISCW